MEKRIEQKIALFINEFKNDIKAKSEIFGGWISIGDQLSSGYAMYDYYKGTGTQPKSK